MRQSNVIFGTLIFAFLVFITMRGQLPAYLDLFKPAEKSTVENKSKGSSIFDKAGDLFNKGKNLFNTGTKIVGIIGG